MTVEAGQYPIVYLRTAPGERLLVAINPTGRPAAVQLPAGLLSAAPARLYGQEGAVAQRGGSWWAELPPACGGVYRIV